jgi:LmbE family N-acetylglucosaminyl deacetylase
MKSTRLRIAAVVFVLGSLVADGRAATTPDAAQLQLALKKLTVVGSALYVAAHPDDENTAMLSFLTSERLLRSGYLSMTRGDGGQNLIGSEKGELLGVVRTQELLAARRIDGAEQFFTRALDFGYSKNPEETLRIWGHDAILADVVWTIRRFQPDVIITRFPTTGEGGHGHHTASAILAGEAFQAAGDPTRFPEQLRYVGVWQPRRLFWNLFRTPGKDVDLSKLLAVDLGTYNPLLGRAYTEIAAESRSQHKSQGFGSAERRGSIPNYLSQLAGDSAKSDPFEGINLTWSRYAGGEAVGAILEEAYRTFDPKNPSATIPLLLRADAELTRLGASPAWSPRANPWIEVKRRDLGEAIRACAGMSIDVNAADSFVTPGSDIGLTTTVVNRSTAPFRLDAVGSLYGDPSKAPGAALKNNEPVKTEIALKVPADFDISRPYWLRQPPSKGTYTVSDQELIGLPDNPSALPLIVTIGSGIDQGLFYNVPLVYRWTDPVRGEQTRPVDIVPEISVNPDQKVYLFPDQKARPINVALHSFVGATTGTVRLVAPSGWTVTPESASVSFKEKNDEQRVTFQVTPPGAAASGDVHAEVTLPNGKKLSYALTTIDYPHIPAQRIFSDAAAHLVRLDIRRKGQRIGYIMGPGDEVPDALRQVGYDVDLLTDNDLDHLDLGRYSAIVTGVRAYNTRKRLRIDQSHLLDYVQRGGTLVVQYNTLDDLLVPAPGPYPFKISHDRVTVEEAPVKVLAADDPLLNTPNRITSADFDGWVQERGLYFASEWDPKYRAILETHDPGESDKPGGMLVANYGKGTFIYTSYSWFRQLPAGVPGAYKLFVNLVSAGH